MTQPDETQPQTDLRVHEATEKAVQTLFGVGRLWATHGLTIGRAALETSATTLRMTSELLGEISDRLDAQDEAPPAETTDDEPTE